MDGRTAEFKQKGVDLHSIASSYNFKFYGRFQVSPYPSPCPSSLARHSTREKKIEKKKKEERALDVVMTECLR